MYTAIGDPVLIFALAMVTFLLAPMLMHKLRTPGLIGLILAGVIIGPNGLGLLERDNTIVLLGTVGLLYIIFIAGLEIDLEGFQKYRRDSVIYGSFSFAIPFFLGLVLALVLGYSLTASVLLGSILGSHTLLAYPIASRLGITKNRAITTTVGGVVITDTGAMLVLAIIAAMTQGQINAAFWMVLLVSIILYVTLVFLILPFLSKIFFRKTSHEGSREYIFVMTMLFASAAGATFAGLEPIIGAFLAGLALNRYILEHGPLMNRIKFVGNALFIPFFLLSVGMLMDVRLFIESPESWALAGGMILLLPIGKWLAVYFSSKLFHFNKTEEKVMFGLSVPQAAATLAATLVGYDLGLFDQTTVNGVIFMILITCMIGPYVVEKYGRQMALNEEVSFSRTKQDAGRVLIPLSQTTTTTTDALLDLAFLLRTQHSTEHVYALHVVQDQGKPDAKRLAEAEKMLGHAIVYGAAAEVPVQILTPVDANVAAGIERASQEKSIDTILLEWKAETSTESKMFGRKLDQILDLTQQHLIVSKFAHPINTVNKLVLLLPPGSDHQSGFMESVITIKRLAAQLSAQIEVLVVKDKKKRFEGIISGAEPQVTFDMKEADSWEEVLEGPLQETKKDTLVILISGRRGTSAWSPVLEDLPQQLATLPPESFMVMFPPIDQEVDERGARGTEIPKTVMRRSDYED